MGGGEGWGCVSGGEGRGCVGGVAYVRGGAMAWCVGWYCLSSPL